MILIRICQNSFKMIPDPKELASCPQCVNKHIYTTEKFTYRANWEKEEQYRIMLAGEPKISFIISILGIKKT